MAPPTRAVGSGVPWPKRTPERPFSARKTRTVVACPLSTAATAWPTIAQGAEPPGPVMPQ
jgi:hypothetical protein